jgi:hypothetical protein
MIPGGRTIEDLEDSVLTYPLRIIGILSFQVNEQLLRDPVE